jgi:hypothetical protein
MKSMTKKMVNIEGLGMRTLAMEPLFRTVDQSGRIAVGKDMIGKKTLALILIPQEPADLVYGPKPKRQPSLIDSEVFMKNDIEKVLLSPFQEQDRIEELQALFREHGWEGPQKEDIELLEAVIQKVIEDLWSMPLEELDEDYFEGLQEILHEELLDEKTEQDMAIINQAIGGASGFIERATEDLNFH